MKLSGIIGLFKLMDPQFITSSGMKLAFLKSAIFSKATLS